MSLLECGDMSPLLKLAPGRVRPTGGRGHVRALQIPVAQLYCGGR